MVKRYSRQGLHLDTGFTGFYLVLLSQDTRAQDTADASSVTDGGRGHSRVDCECFTPACETWMGSYKAEAYATFAAAGDEA